MSSPIGRSNGSVRRTVKRLVLLLLFALVLEYLVLPQLAGARKALSLVAHANLGLLALGVVLEALSLLSYAALTRSVLPRSPRSPGLGTVARIDLATLAASHIVPGGSAAGTGVGYRLLTESGVEGSDAGFALAVQSIGSAAVLNILLWLALVVSIPVYGFNPVYGTAAVVGIVLIGGFSGLVFALTKGEARAASVVRTIARRIPFLHDETLHRLVHHLAARLRAMGSDRRLVARGVGWAAANWILDAASLWVFVAAFGTRPGVDGLLVAYGLANVLAAIPITPGGLGIVEAVLTSSLVGFGVTRGVAVLGVVAYRLANFWLPIPVGAVSYLSLRADRGARARRRDELGRLAQDAVRASEDLPTWAARHGVMVDPAQPPASEDPGVSSSARDPRDPSGSRGRGSRS